MRSICDLQHLISSSIDIAALTILMPNLFSFNFFFCYRSPALQQPQLQQLEHEFQRRLLLKQSSVSSNDDDDEDLASRGRRLESADLSRGPRAW